MAINVFDSSWLLKGARGVQGQGVDMDAAGLGSPEGLKGLKAPGDKSGLKQLLRSAIPSFKLGQSQDGSPWVGSLGLDSDKIGTKDDAAGETKTEDKDADIATLFGKVPKEDREKLADVVKAKYPGLEDEEGFEKLKGLKGEDWLSMLVELLKENPGLAQKMADRAKANAMPSRGAQTANTNGGSQAAIPSAFQSKNSGPSAPSMGADGRGNTTPDQSAKLNQAGQKSEGTGATGARKHATASGLQPNAARGVEEVRKLGFKGTIGGIRDTGRTPDHPNGNAIDVMTHSDTAMGNKVKNHFVQNAQRLGVKNVIYQQRIYSAKNGWKGSAMKDRGSATANHMDHPHISFYGGSLTGPR